MSGIVDVACLAGAHALCIRYLGETTTRCECECHEEPSPVILLDTHDAIWKGKPR